MKRIIYSFFVATLLIGLVVIPAGASSMGFYVTSVDPNSSVTIHTFGFPEGTNLTVTMGPAGSAGLGYYVTTTYTGEGGVLDRTFPIPEALNGVQTIVLRLESADGEYVAYGPFVNQVGGSAKPGLGKDCPGFRAAAYPPPALNCMCRASFPMTWCQSGQGISRWEPYSMFIWASMAPMV